jgi:integrase/recombinase XerD
LVDLDLAAACSWCARARAARTGCSPVGERVCAWVRRYLDEVRPELVSVPDSGYLFVTDYAEPFEKVRLSDTVHKYVRRAGFAHGACHTFRHAMATHGWRTAADVRYMQVMLDHSELSTKQLYTQCGYRQAQSHPHGHTSDLTHAR